MRCEGYDPRPLRVIAAAPANAMSPNLSGGDSVANDVSRLANPLQRGRPHSANHSEFRELRRTASRLQNSNEVKPGSPSNARLLHENRCVHGFSLARDSARTDKQHSPIYGTSADPGSLSNRQTIPSISQLLQETDLGTSAFFVSQPREE